jgi:hypothetical protein
MKAGISIQLEPEEQVALQHHAENLGVDREDIAYVALQRLLAELKDHPQPLGRSIIEARDHRHYHFAGWSGLAHTHHPFDPDDEGYSVPGL